MISSIVLIGVSLGWLALPLIPAVQELRHPTDAGALDVFQGNAADAQDQVHTVLPRILDGSSIVSPPELAQYNVMLWSDSELCSPELFPAKALVHQGELTLRGAVTGLVSIHAQSLKLLASATTSAKLSASRDAWVCEGSSFQVLQAPVIRAGAIALVQIEREPSVLTPGTVLNAEYHELQGWWRADASALVLASTRVTHDIVSSGDVTLEPGSFVTGSIKAKGSVELKSGARVQGNIVAHSVALGPSSSVGGCVLADVFASVGAGATVGAANAPATLSAPVVTLTQGACVFGGIYARTQATVLG